MIKYNNRNVSKKTRDKILYIMHVDWGWIKQRPHFLAEGLEKYFNVLVLYRFNPNRKNMLSNSSAIKKLPLITIPRRFGYLFEKIDNFIQKLWLLIIILCFKPDKIWLTFPIQYKYLPKIMLKKVQIIYDCMDDALEFYKDERRRRNIESIEKDLIEDAKAVFCSSQHLSNVLINRYGETKKIIILRNGINEQFLSKHSIVEETTNQPFFTKEEGFIDIVYIGTVAPWINFDLIDNCLDHFKNIKFHFIGPIDMKMDFRNKDRIIIHGAAEHEELRKNANLYDILIMPFIRNELIESVDPVKLYEYISFNKPIISIYYPEIARFKPFVEFYETEDQFIKIIDKIINNRFKLKYDVKEGMRFLEENTWRMRVECIKNYLNVI
ncbi:hypothetical protein [Bacillus smithii]|uniref:hypothetical protein n=1 Tax=Bacillus smithii TaxID=1479 RepID=UPI0030C9BA68